MSRSQDFILKICREELSQIRFVDFHHMRESIGANEPQAWMDVELSAFIADIDAAVRAASLHAQAGSETGRIKRDMQARFVTYRAALAFAEQRMKDMEALIGLD